MPINPGGRQRCAAAIVLALAPKEFDRPSKFADQCPLRRPSVHREIRRISGHLPGRPTAPTLSCVRRNSCTPTADPSADPAADPVEAEAQEDRGEREEDPRLYGLVGPEPFGGLVDLVRSHRSNRPEPAQYEIARSQVDGRAHRDWPRERWQVVRPDITFDPAADADIADERDDHR